MDENTVPVTELTSGQLYDKAILVLSGLDFESVDLSEDGDLKPEIETAVHVVARIFDKEDSEVLEALTQQRALEAQEVRDIDQDIYGHLNQYGETPGEVALMKD